MYCNNCGSQIQEDQPFCGKCGKANVAPKVKVCEKCGHELESGTKFCHVCGTSLNEERHFCCFCGTEIKKGEGFCISCGKAANGKVARSSVTVPLDASNDGESEGGIKGVVKKTNMVLSNQVSRLGGDFSSARLASLGWKHMAVGLMLVVIMLLWLLPVFSFEIPVLSMISSEEVNVLFSLAKPYSDELSYAMSASEKTMTAILVLVFDYIPMLLTCLYVAFPFFKKTFVKRRRMVVPIIQSIYIVLRVLFTWIIYVAAVNDSADGAVEVGLTFGGWLIILLAAGMFALSLYVSSVNKKIVEEVGQ